MYNAQGPRILYREHDSDQDIIEKVYRWDTHPYQEIFQTGFTPWPQSPTQSWANYYNLVEHVNNAGIPGDPAIRGSVFVKNNEINYMETNSHNKLHTISL